MKITPHIRWMIRRDMAEVMDIEGMCFKNSWVLGSDCEPPLKGSFVHHLRQRNCIGMVAEYDEKVVAYMVYGLGKTRIDVLRFAVLPSMQGRGIGRAMTEKLKGKLSSQRRARVVFGVDESNLDAQLFLRACGFKCVSVTHGMDGGEDEYMFVLRYAGNKVSA